MNNALFGALVVAETLLEADESAVAPSALRAALANLANVAKVKEFSTIDRRWKISTTPTHVYFVGSPFSQWFGAEIEGDLPFLNTVDLDTSVTLYEPDNTKYEMQIGNIRRFSCCEQYMMAGKAMLFKDFETLGLIMSTRNPKDQKALGRAVSNFSAEAWKAVARDVVTMGNLMKFTQHDNLRAFLFTTGHRKIVEGAWYDEVWGVKLAWDDPRILNEANWQGTNWLGECLMTVRAALYDQLLLDIDPLHNSF